MRTTQQTQAAEVLFIESNVTDYQSLMDAATPGTEVHLLDASLDGLAQIANILAGRSGINAIHIVSHGSAGVLNLGALQLTAQSLPEHSATLTAIGGALNPEADVLLYGCDIAQGSAGAAFIEALAQATQADVSASTDSTGAAGLGGNWALEQSTGAIETAALALQDFQGVLGNGIILVSASASGAVGDNHLAATPSISADGRYVAFASEANNLVPGDTNGSGDTFVKDVQTGAIIRASTSASGEAGNSTSFYTSISADGRFVAFASGASNLVPSDTNGNWDIFIKDTQTGAISRVSISASGDEGNSYSYKPSISADGRYVAFVSGASNLVPGDTNNSADVFIKDTQTGAITRVSISASGAQSNGNTSYNNGDSTSISSSTDGRYVAFYSEANNLVPGDTNNALDIFVKNTQTGDITRVSTSANGAEANSWSIQPSISADGRYVAFASGASNLLGDVNNTGGIFVKNTQTGAITRVSNSGGNPSISADGRYVAFVSGASNLVPGDTNGLGDIFIKDTQTGVMARVSTSANGTEGNNSSSSPSISADGRYVTFQSAASNLVPGYTGRSSDVFRVNNPLIPGTSAPTITISPVTTSIIEGDSFGQSLTFIVNLSAASSNAVTVTYATANGSATSGSDYSSVNGTLSFAAGEISKTISVPILGDTTAESNETFTFALSNPSGATLGSGASTTATILDNDSQATLGNNIIRVSTSASGTESNSSIWESSPARTSADGRYVAFVSGASNLVPGDNNYRLDIFIKDTQTGAITRASTSASGADGNGDAYDFSISADGRYVAFMSYANNLVPGDTNGFGDIFLKDTQTGTITRVSTSASGAESNADNDRVSSISADGRYVAFSSTASNLVPNDSNNSGDVFVKDTQTGAITRVSTSASGIEGDSYSYTPGISANGRYVTFKSYASNLVPGDTNGLMDIFIKDTQTGVIARVSTSANGTEENNSSDSPSINADGRYVAFCSEASNLVLGDTNGKWDIFIKDTQTGAITRASTSANGTEGNNDSGDENVGHTSNVPPPSISADGRYVAFQSYADNLVPGDTNATWDIFVKDMQTGAIALVSTSAGGTKASSGSYSPGISADGRYITFHSTAANLVAGDSGLTTDVFRVNNPLITPTITLSPTTASITEGDSGSQSLSFTASLSTASTNAVTINYATVNGTATSSSDYVATSGTLGFAPGETSKTITVPILGDTSVESNETFTLTLSNPSGAVLGSAVSATATIVDNDAATLPPASVPGTASNDFVVPSVGNATYFGGAGSDTYIINPHILSSAVTVTIIDTEGSNVIQLNDGLTIASSTFYNNAVQLTLSTGANVRVLGASGFTYQVGANILTGDTANSQTYAQFAATLGASVPTGSTSVSGTANFVVPTGASAAIALVGVGVDVNGLDTALASGMLSL